MPTPAETLDTDPEAPVGPVGPRLPVGPVGPTVPAAAQVPSFRKNVDVLPLGGEMV